MDKKTSSLIANSGLQFKKTEMEINVDEPLLLQNGKTLKYTFLETIDFLDNCRIRIDLCSSKEGQYVPVNFLKENHLFEETPSGMVSIDESGIPVIKKDAALALMEIYQSGSPELVSVNSLSSLKIKKNGELLSGFDLLLNKWLPMPMYEIDVSGESSGYPNGWCRVKIEEIGGAHQKGCRRFRLVWAFDTTLAEDPVEGLLRPTFLAGSGESKEYKLCNRPDLLLGEFLNIPDGNNDAPISDYLVSLLGIDLQGEDVHKYKFLGFYIYLINYLRLVKAAPDVTLYYKKDKEIPVDMSVDIGNSRTCAVLFENGDFTKARMLGVRDLTAPWKLYENAFDMRIVFRKADFGNDLILDKNLFVWPSIVRVGEEAKNLVYKSLENNGESERTTNYSSPKRYLWDNKRFENRWEFMVTQDDPTNLKVNSQIFVEGFTDYFDDDGTFEEEPKGLDIFSLGLTDDQCHYSRSSLMTFVMIEMMNQAFCYINSNKFREMHGQVDCRRYLRNIIITCPTAMPLEEQVTLRRAAVSATRLLAKLMPGLPQMTIIPDPEKIMVSDDDELMQKRGWLYDEAFASQLVYLYSEAVNRYGGKLEEFFKIKGHYRKDMAERGFDINSLTIGTIDIGAGTTDVMVTAYGQKGNGRLTPVPLYYDSFYSAGDDIIHNIIRDVILEGPDNELETIGSIGSALAVRIMKMTPDELLTIPLVANNKNYSNLVDDIRHAMNEDIAKDLKWHLTHELMHHFFADNSANQSESDRICRLDFCTQISVPMAQFFLELLKQGRPTKLYTFDDIFNKEKPADYLLDHFENHFGFRFESLNWRYDPQIVGNIVRDTMEPIVKVLSVVMYALHCDILVLSGRPTNLEPLTELFLKYIPIPPSRLVRLNQYRVGRWFPLATEEGYFQENQKAVVAVGAEVGHLASTTGFNGLVLDFSNLSKDMKSTARYMGWIDDELMEVKTPFVSPTNGSANLKAISTFPCFIGCKQYDVPKYPARPIYAIYNNSDKSQLNVLIQRNYMEDREKLVIEDVTDMEGESVPLSDVELRLQTLTKDGNFWMDKGAFRLKIQEKL